MIQFDLSLIPEPVRTLCDLLGPQKSYVVGGIIRDSLLSNPDSEEETVRRVKGNDWDLATPLRPPEVMSRLHRARITAVPIGIEHGTVAAIISGEQYEITTFRYDLEYRDGRHPIVRFADSLEEDLRRRDFTINAFALDVETGAVLDLFSGQEDLQARIIRAVGDPDVRFREDHLRMLRAVRFAAKLAGDIEPVTFAAIQRHAPSIQSISAERIRDEILKMLECEKPSEGFLFMRRTGLLTYILPELEAGFGVLQNRFHADDVALHTLHAIDALSPKYPFLRFVTLLHDLGKVGTKQYHPDKGDYVFYGHQYLSRKMGRRIMQRLRFSNKQIEAASAIVENHMYNLKPDLSEAATRRFVRRLGRENVEGFLRMRMADRKGNQLNSDGYEKGIFHFARTVRKINRAEDALKVRDLHISGHDLMDLGLTPGPIFSTILNQLLEEALDDPSLNCREWLLPRARDFAEEYKQTGKITLPQRVTPDEETNETGGS